MDAHFALSQAVRQIFLAAVAFGLLTAGTAIAATFPVDDGNGFDANTEGWTATAASCEPSAGPLCAVANTHATDQGNPPGSIESRMSVLLNGGGLFQGLGTWRSPTFKATAEGGGALRYDRRIETAGLVTLGPEVTIESVLVNESNGNSKSLGSETLDSTDSAFVNHPVAVAEGTLQSGDNHHIELRSTLRTTQAQAGILGSVAVRFDNVALQVANTGPGGSSGSPGVTFPDQPLSDKEIAALLQQPGGVSKKQCTIVGTPKADRITGSRGNDVICGLGGNDRITGRGGRDVIDAGAGKDRANGSSKPDKVVGMAGKDRLYGGSGGDRVNGGKGRDRLAGNGGNDRLAGGAGRDRVNGGPGRDRAVGGARDKVRRVERPR